MSDVEVEEPLELEDDGDHGEDIDLNTDGEVSVGPRSFLAGLVLGTVLGLSVALLFAPEPGEDTRRKLGKRIRRLRKRAEDETGELRRRARKRLAQVRR